MPLGPDLFSIQALRNLGPRLRIWRTEWQERVEKNRVPDLELPKGSMKPLGYIVMQHTERRRRPVKSYRKWIGRIPEAYQKHVLGDTQSQSPEVDSDPNCIATMKHYRSLMAMAQEARKPLFHLKAADGALGAHFAAVRDAYQDFKRLSLDIVSKAGISLDALHLPASRSKS